jgi:hypothetical protein
MAAGRIRIGVVGCGLISQVMHLPYLSELGDRFELVAVCDIAPEVAGGCAERYGVCRVFSRWEDLIAEPLDAVLVATSGDHAPIALAAARAGRHVMVEKPLALCSRDGELVLEAGREAGVCILVGTMKRYDPAYERLAELLPDVEDVRLIRVTTLESPIPPHVAHYPLIERNGKSEHLPPELERAEQAAIDAALGDAGEQTRWCYRRIVVQTLVHEFNMLGGLLGEPDEIRSVSLSPQCVGINMRFGEAECHLSWVLLPGIARYRQELAFYAPGKAADAGAAVAVSAQHAEQADRRGRRCRHCAQLAARGGRLLRRGIQARAGRVRRLHRDRARAAHVGRRRAARRAARRGGRPVGRRYPCAIRLRNGTRWSKNTLLGNAPAGSLCA